MIKFRMIQCFAMSSMLGMWIVRALTHPHFHPTLLISALIMLAVSEVSYLAGKNENKHKINNC